MDKLSPGIKEPLCGYQWVWQHQHDLDGWHPTFELISDGYSANCIETVYHNIVVQGIDKTAKV